MRGIDMAGVAAGVADGEKQVVKANQRDRMREMLDRNGVLPPEPEGDAPAPISADLGEIAADEQGEMEGYHGLNVDDASGMKMFCALRSARAQLALSLSRPPLSAACSVPAPCLLRRAAGGWCCGCNLRARARASVAPRVHTDTGNTLSQRKRSEKQKQFHIVRFYVELARHGQTIGADVERPLEPRQARVAHTIYNSRRYAAWLGLVYTLQMSLSYYEPAYFGQPAEEVPQHSTSWLPATLDLACIMAYGADALGQIYVAGWRDFSTRTINRLYFLLLGSMFGDLIMGGVGFARFARPLLVMVRHARIRAEIGLMWRSLSQCLTAFAMLLAILALGSVFSVVLLRHEYGGELLPYLGTGVASASSVGGFTNVHRSFLTLLSLLVSSDSYQFVYLANDYPQLALQRNFAVMWMAALYGCMVIAALNCGFSLLGAYQQRRGPTR